MRDPKLYIRDNKIPRQHIFKIKITHEQEGWPIYTQGIKQALDLSPDDDRVLLSNGRWMRFNQDYLDFLDDSLSSILVEDTGLGIRHIALLNRSSIRPKKCALAPTRLLIKIPASSVLANPHPSRRGI
jgi:hypothetical protein